MIGRFWAVPLGVVAGVLLFAPAPATAAPGPARGPDVYRAYTVTPAEVRPELIPLVDGTVRVSFAVDVHIEVFNNSRPTPRPCSTSWLYRSDSDKTHYQTLTLEHRKHPAADVPLKGAKAIVKDNVEREISETGKRC